MASWVKGNEKVKARWIVGIRIRLSGKCSICGQLEHKSEVCQGKPCPVSTLLYSGKW